jgi:galactonate dehydratase
MKISDLRVFWTEGVHSNWVFVKIYTDSGITGVGEASIERFDDVVVRALESFKDFLVGKDPFQSEYIWNAIYKSTFWHGGIIILTALSAVEQALMDIKGKALGVPVYELLGGKLRDRVRAYANAWAFQEVVTELKAGDTPGSMAKNALKMVEKGFTAMKWDPFRRGGQVIPKSEEEFAVACVKAVREAVGPSVDLLIECHGRFNMHSAIRMAQKLEPFDPFFYEEPIPPDNIDAMAELQRAIRLPIATGERLFTRWDFRLLLEKQAARIIQPDISHAGGILEVKKIAAMAETYYIAVQPHSSVGPILNLANLHLDASIPNVVFQEFFYPYLELYNEMLTEPIKCENGYLEIPTRPGLGSDINEKFIQKRPPAPQPQLATWMGSYW